MGALLKQPKLLRQILVPVAGLSLLAASFSGAPAAVAAGTASISGSVQMQAGLNASMIIIDAYKDGLYVDETRIWSGSGTYTLDGLEPGTYKVKFSAFGGRWWRTGQRRRMV